MNYIHDLETKTFEVETEFPWELRSQSFKVTFTMTHQLFMVGVLPKHIVMGINTSLKKNLD